VSAPVSGTSPSGQNSPSSSTGNAFNVTGQQFLDLLVAQLKYQNPMQPLDSSQFLGQLATLEQVQLLQNIQTDLDTLVKGGTTPTQGSTTPSKGSGG